ncbi:FtsX-like permease family protein [Dokdonella sp.]|uniref:FtsX-like permease family protein n=1 Tax=Dokdonella sp. TaxID=2291710 RepID=UPI002B9C5854|nr:FtsX-like permease family protein [Dokdonella sp.]HPN78793.1 ABC transporter permease [Dokdonella sp.]
MKPSAWLRGISRAPMFAFVVIVLVACVVAINASTFSAIHALRWKALPYADDDALLEMRGDMRKFGFIAGLNAAIRDALEADRTHFSGVAGFTGAGQERLDASGQRWRLVQVTPRFEQVLGVAAAIGRSIVDGDAVDGADQVIAISDRAWRERFNADPAVIGRLVDFGKMKLRVIGVMPPGFAFPDTQVDAWRPYVPGSDGRSFGDLEVVARAAPGTSVEQARELLAALIANAPQLADLAVSAGIQADVRPWRERYSSGHERALDLLQLAALILLVVTVANVVNLNLDHLLMRRRELAIRRALGASERAIARDVAADVLPPAVIGLVLGLALTPFGLRVIGARGLLPEFLPQSAGFGPAAIIGACLATVLIVATVLLVAWLAQRGQGLSSRAGIAGMGRLRPALLVGQVMLTTILLGGSALLLRSAINLISTDRGFTEQGVLMTMVDPLGVSVDNAVFNPDTDRPRVRALMERIREAVAALPGVDHVAFADAPPFSHSEAVSTMRVPGVAETQSVRSRVVSPGYFTTLGIGLSAGRDFASTDFGEAAPVIIDAAYQKRYLQGVDPLDSFVEVTDRGDVYRKARIIGVAHAIKHEALDEAEALPVVYEPVAVPVPVAFLLTHTSGDVRQLAETLRQRIPGVQPGTVILFNKPLADSIAETLAPRRALLEAIVTFGAATLLLASIGLAAVLSFSIRRRTAELGVRLAIGASPSSVRNLVLRQGVILIASGGLLGLCIGIPLARLLSDRLYRVVFTDAMSWLAAAVVVLLIASAACWLPARRAAATDPIEALRHE